MNRQFHFSILSLFLFAIFSVNAGALRSIGGAEPVFDKDRDWPAGCENVANFPMRFCYEMGGTLGNRFEDYLYTGDTAKFQAALDAFAAIDAPRLDLIILDGGRSDSLYWSKQPADWRFSVSFRGLMRNSAAITLPKGELPPVLKVLPPPRLTLFLENGNPVDFSKIRIPAKVTVIDKRVETSPYKDSKGGVIRVRILDEATSQPIAGAILTMSTYGPKDKKTDIAINADNRGVALARDLPVGNYSQLTISAPGFTPREIGSCRNHGKTYENLDDQKLSKATRQEGLGDVNYQRHQNILKTPKLLVALDDDHAPYYALSQQFDESDLPSFIECLVDKGSSALICRQAANYIGLISKRGNDKAIGGLMEYFRQPVDWKRWSDNKSEMSAQVVAKWNALLWIGAIGGEDAEKYLLHVMTLDGAEEQAKEWLDGVPEVVFKRDSVLDNLRGSAANGLAFSANPSIHKMIVSEYNREKASLMAKNQVASGYFYQLCDAMARTDVLKEIGSEKHKMLYDGKGGYSDMYGKYVGKYMIQKTDGRIYHKR